MSTTYSALDRQANRPLVSIFPWRWPLLGGEKKDQIADIDQAIAELTRRRLELSGQASPNVAKAIDRVSGVVTTEWGVTRQDQDGSRRDAWICDGRHARVALTLRLAKASYSELGRALGRHHGAMLHSRRAVERLLDVDPKFAARYRRAEAALGLEAA